MQNFVQYLLVNISNKESFYIFGTLNEGWKLIPVASLICKNRGNYLNGHLDSVDTYKRLPLDTLLPPGVSKPCHHWLFYASIFQLKYFLFPFYASECMMNKIATKILWSFNWSLKGISILIIKVQ